jgi:hypothetical protein
MSHLYAIQKAVFSFLRRDRLTISGFSHSNLGAGRLTLGPVSMQNLRATNLSKGVTQN